MKILITVELEGRLVEAIRAVSDEVEVLCASGEEALSIVPKVEVVCGGIGQEMFLKAEKLRWVQSWGAGVDEMLFPEMVASEVVLTSAKGTVGVHLAEHAMALLLGLTRGINRAVRKPSWDQRFPIRSLSWELLDRTMGIVGLGGTGRELATRAGAFGMRIVAVDPEEVEVPPEVEICWKMGRFNDLLAESDVVAVCAPLTKETQGLFDSDAFSRMLPHALLINVTRGKIVDEQALMKALTTGQIGGAGLDVLPEEPLPEDHPLWKMENVLITPHTAGGSPNRNDRLVDLFCENLKRFLAGKELLSPIDKEKGY